MSTWIFGAIGVAAVAAASVAAAGRAGGLGLGFTRKQRMALSNRMQQRWADALLERQWRMRVWMREQERARNINFDAILDSTLPVGTVRPPRSRG